MGTRTNVSWTDHTQNYWWGCVKPSDECRNCYAEGIAKRWGRDIWGPAANTKRWILGPANWKNPAKWEREARQDGFKHKSFLASMSDFYEDHPDVTETRNRVLSEVIPATPNIIWQILTKRPENVLRMSPPSWGEHWPSNVWIGTSVGRQVRAEERLPELLKIPAPVRFASLEPLLEPLNITEYLPGLQWVIVGGESGPKHRPFMPVWAEDIRIQAQRYGVAYFFKQVGGFAHASGGDLLFGKEYKEFPMYNPTIESEKSLWSTVKG